MAKNKNKILIADDETDISLILKLQLEDAGYRTIRVKDGVEALDALAKEPFELLLLDIKMPRMDGLQVLRKARELYPAMVVIMMTAHGSEDIAVASMKDGALDYIAKPFSHDDLLKRVERALSFNRTMLENTRLERQLAAEQKKTEAILQGMAELLVAVDVEGKVISVNRKTEEVLGSSREALLGRYVGEVLAAEREGDAPLPCLQTLESGIPTLDVTYDILGARGRIPVLASASPLCDTAGTLIGSVEIIRDISSLKALEREREDFVSMLSHDLKNPITSIVGSLDLVLEGRLGPINKDQREFIEAAEESCSEMVEMINSLLDIHKFEAGRMVMRFQPEKPQHLLDKLITQYTTAARKYDVALSVRAAHDLPECPLDRHTFMRMIGNLISNALKFTAEGGTITVSADCPADLAALVGTIPAGLYATAAIPRQGRYLRIQIVDTGCGIPAESLATIFDRFIQAQNRREGKTRGSGLGLAFCRKVMDAHKGLIWVESEEGKGSRFTALFPLEPAGESIG